MSEERYISGMVGVSRKVELTLDRLHCTDCDEDYDIDDVEIVADDGYEFVAKCPDCEEILAQFVE